MTEYCSNHSMTEAYSICHNCGKHFCQECLTEGNEYYYCKADKCQRALKAELEKQLPGEFSCPVCSSIVQLNEEEMKKKLFRCPECESLINISSKEPEVIKSRDYVEILSSLNQGDIALIHSILDDAGIDYNVAGENFLTVRPLLERARVFVAADQVETAKELLKDLEIHIFGFSTSQEKEEDEGS